MMRELRGSEIHTNMECYLFSVFHIQVLINIYLILFLCGRYILEEYMLKKKNLVKKGIVSIT